MSATLFQHTKNVIICARWQSRAQKNCLYVHDTHAILKNEKNCGIATSCKLFVGDKKTKK